MIRAPDRPWPIARAAVELIADKEQGPNGGPALKAYKCPAGVWTLGLGETDGIKPGMTCTADQAWDMLLRDLTTRTQAAQAMLTLPANDNQLGAMVSLVYNIGLEAFKKSSVLRLHNKGDFAGAARAFLLWDKARVAGKLQVLAGLTARRAAESALYLTPDEHDWREPMPQAVEPEQAPVASTRVQAGAATAGLGVVGAIGEAKEALGPVGEAVASAKGLLADTLGIPTQYVPLALLVAVGAFLIYHFTRQRREGVA